MRADTVTKEFISDAHVFADVFNYYIYDGQQVIRPEQLMECDATKIALPYGNDSAVVPVQKFRDVQKLYTAMTDGSTEYLLYGVENQTQINYAMPVKNGLYDMLDYSGQVERASRSHREAMKEAKENRQETDSPPSRKPDPGEFLGGFWKDDQLIPSVTVTIYFGSDEWDGPMSLFDMLKVTDSRILSYLDNYHIQLIAPARMSDEEIMKFQTNLREVLLYIKYSKDKKKLSEILESDKARFHEVERRAADVIRVITNSNFKYGEKELKIDVCQAIKEMQEEAQKIGDLNRAKKDARNFYSLGVDVEKVAQGVGYDLDTVRTWLGLSGN